MPLFEILLKKEPKEDICENREGCGKQYGKNVKHSNYSFQN
jgi:hypothetical protein